MSAANHTAMRPLSNFETPCRYMGATKYTAMAAWLKQFISILQAMQGVGVWVWVHLISNTCLCMTHQLYPFGTCWYLISGDLT